jgi:hypothetical protein
MSLLMPEIQPADRQPIEDAGPLSAHEAEYSKPRRSRAATPAAPDETTTAPAAPATPASEPSTEEHEPTAAEIASQPNLAYEDKPKKHRAKSQLARPEDVPRIKELTRKLKEAEEALAAVRRAPVTPETPAETVVPTWSAPAATSTFTDPEPTLDQFNDKPDPYSAYLRAVAAYDRKKEAWDAKQAETQTQATQSRQALVEKVSAQVAAFRAKTPEYDQAIEAIKGETAPDLLMAALLSGDNFPDLVYYLATHPVDRHEMHLITDGKPVTDQHVASVRRILDARMQAGSTGAAAPLSPVPRKPFKPPTPVRTGPMTTGEEPPGDGASLADHERFFKPRRRR